MRTWIARVLLSTLFAAFAISARAQEVSAGTVVLPSAGENGAVAVFTIQNGGMYVAYLMSATSDVAARVEFRDATKPGQPLTYIAIEPGDTKTLTAKGVHVYLTGLTRPLRDGETVTVTFKNEGEIPIEAAATVKRD